MNRWFVAALGAAFVALQPVPSAAQMVCGERAKFIVDLDKVYSETPVAMGLSSTGAVIEVLSSSSGTWTILITYPSGPTCMVAAGEAWDTLPLPVFGRIN